jgi:O-antigen ligase
MLFVVVGIVMLGALSWIWGGRHNHPDLRRRIGWLFITGAVVVIVVFSGSVGIFETSASRVHQAIEGHSNTIYIRLFLWRMGIQTFLENPLLGVGIGQFQKMAAFQPLWHLDPMAQFSQNLGAHNDAISYAAETGVIGLLTVLAFFWGIIRIGWRGWQRADTVEALSQNLVVWVPCLALAVRFFYGTHMFYSLGGLFNCLYFGLLIAHSRSSEPTLPHHVLTNATGVK